METKDTLFLTTDQAAEAVCADLRHYEPQIMLACELIRLISGGRTSVRRDPQKHGAWLAVAGRQKMRWLDATALIDYACAILETSDLTPDLLASVCARVFQTRAGVEKDPDSGRVGIRIETGMEAFDCKQCGRCCLSLDYQDQLTQADVEKWHLAGRADILEWVGVFEGKDGEKTYRIWMTPGTRKLADRCPFLVKDPSSKRWACRIHAIKPAICRHYPVSRKHAVMTGCPGLDSHGPDKR